MEIISFYLSSSFSVTVGDLGMNFIYFKQKFINRIKNAKFIQEIFVFIDFVLFFIDLKNHLFSTFRVQLWLILLKFSHLTLKSIFRIESNVKVENREKLIMKNTCPLSHFIHKTRTTHCFALYSLNLWISVSLVVI